MKIGEETSRRRTSRQSPSQQQARSRPEERQGRRYPADRSSQRYDNRYERRMPHGNDIHRNASHKRTQQEEYRRQLARDEQDIERRAQQRERRMQEQKRQYDSDVIKSSRKTATKKKSRAGDIISVIILIVAIAVACIAGYKLYSIMMEYKAGVDEYSSIADTVIKERDADEEKVKRLKGVQGREEKHWTPPFDVDFDELKAINQDVAGWLYIEALPDISYPIVQGTDNEYYLHHTYKKESVFAGSIFVDAKNTKDFSDQNTIVYGHNMKNGSMFGTLKNFKKQEVIEKSQYFWIITPDDAYKYKIFSTYTAKVNGDTYTLIKGPGQETIDYGNAMKTYSLFNTGDYEFKETDKIVTLSTCTGDTSTRFVVQGVRIEP